MQPDPKEEIITLLPRLRRFALSLTGEPATADDLVQDSCLKALERWHQWRPGTNLASWMFRIVQTSWIDQFRMQQRRKTDSDSEAVEHLADPVVGNQGEHRSELRAVEQAMQQLTDEQRSVLVLVGVEEMSYREAAEVLGVPPGTVMSRLARARTRLAAELENQRGSQNESH